MAVADAVRVGEEDLARLQAANPKGRLLEWCARQKWPMPQFEQQASPDGYRVRAVVNPESEHKLCSAWHLAATLKAAEQAASESVLETVCNRPAGREAEAASGSPVPEAAKLVLETGDPVLQTAEPVKLVPEASERNVAMLLNELKQAGILQASGYEVVQEGGPSHQPVFATVAWATTPDGRTWRTVPVRASSKKAGQRSAAESLVDILVEQGVTGR
jgi:dsRNA-specific ribonuclease